MRLGLVRESRIGIGAAWTMRPLPAPNIQQDGLTGTGRGAGLPDAARRQLVDKGIQAVI